MDLNAQVEASGSIHHPEIEGYSMHSKNRTAVCTASCVTLWSYAKGWEMRDTQLTESHALGILRVVYDTKTGRLEVQRHVLKHFVRWDDVAFF